MSKQRRHKTPIDIVLSRAQNLQTTCFGTSVGITIEASRGAYDEKMLTITVYCDASYNDVEKSCTIYSSSSKEEITQAWGSIKDEVDKLLNEFVGHRITAKGNLKQLAP